MKKIFIFGMLALFMCSVCACSSCKKNNDEKQKTDSTLVLKGELTLENVISSDREYMFMKYGGDYRWYESCAVFNCFLDGETDGTVNTITNIFQVITEKDTGYDTNVVMITHTADSTDVAVMKGFWVEDFPLNDEEISVTLKEAFDKVMAVNMPKPHSKQVVLRKEVGPNNCNPQYIFGNSKGQIYVNATNGDVSDKNPVFDNKFQMPLGEWP